MSEQEISTEARLQEPFEPNDIRWRVQQSGVKNGRVWMIVLPYITGRAIQKRLDDVFGVFGWEVEQKETNAGDGFICTISVLNNGRWIKKQDVSPKTGIEPLKGGASGALKRAGALLGIGRYLYQLTSGFATCVPCDNQRDAVNNFALVKDKNGSSSYPVDWAPPPLPGWALPGLDTEKFISDIRNAKTLSELTIAFDDAYRWASSFSKLDLMADFKREKNLAIENLKSLASSNVDKNEKEVDKWFTEKLKNIEAVGYVGAVTSVSNQILSELIAKCEGQLFDRNQFKARLKKAVSDRIKTLETQEEGK